MKIKKPINIFILGIASFVFSPIASASPNALARDGEESFRVLFKEMVETDSSKRTGSCTSVANKAKAWMVSQGFPAKFIKVYEPDEDAKAGNLLMVWPGENTSAKALMLNGHIDVVNAKASDWKRDPFILIEENGRFYGRGTADMKAQSSIFVDTLVRLYKHGYKPQHTLKLSLTCGEEAGSFINGVEWLGKHQREAFDAGLVISEGGGGMADKNGKPQVLTISAAYKRGANFQLQATDIGGHSSAPGPRNAIYVMADALRKLQQFDFPLELNPENGPQFKTMGAIEGGELGKALVAISENPNDQAAKAVIDRHPRYRAASRTVCSPTTVEGGHAPNALPQRVVVNVNCRVMPRTDIEDVRATLAQVIGDPQIEILGPNPPSFPVPIMTIPEPFLETYKRLAEVHFPGVPVTPAQSPASTDAKRFRSFGMGAWGLSGLFFDSETNSHGLDESISIKTVMDARPFVYDAIKALDKETFYDKGLYSD